ncbi:MAG: hypothetical protein F6K09_10395 [Merismopedia sp. SIO2A8]|nr:hypothetical protein [Merismopedia sp. SIO2A8]
MPTPPSHHSESSDLPESEQFNLSPLIRVTLLLLYAVLLVPLPFLATATDAPVAPMLLWLGIGLGGSLLYASLTERVLVDDQRIQVTYSQWVPSFWRKGWTLEWTEITALKPRSTGQGGIVYYFLTGSEHAYLLPMRVAGFARLLDYVQAYTDINMNDVKPLAQPWMYIILLGCAVLLGFVDAWVIWTSVTLA